MATEQTEPLPTSEPHPFYVRGIPRLVLALVCLLIYLLSWLFVWFTWKRGCFFVVVVLPHPSSHPPELFPSLSSLRSVTSPTTD